MVCGDDRKAGNAKILMQRSHWTNRTRAGAVVQFTGLLSGAEFGLQDREQRSSDRCSNKIRMSGVAEISLWCRSMSSVQAPRLTLRVGEITEVKSWKKISLDDLIIRAWRLNGNLDSLPQCWGLRGHPNLSFGIGSRVDFFSVHPP